LLFIVKLVKKILAMLGLDIRRIGGTAPDITSFREQIYESTKGVLHIGGHRGQEAKTYARAKAKVIWFEALEDIYTDLKKKLKDFPEQEAVNALLGDEEKVVNFHVASNDGMSSSIYPFAEHNGFQLAMTDTVLLNMKRLDKLLTAEQARNYPHWVVDVQGAELSVLKGAGRLLDSCQTIDVEVSTFDVYEGGVNYAELDKFLRREGFLPLWQPGGRTHEDLIYIRARPSFGNPPDLPELT
jgi:FkbM family methyltransferase